MARFAFLPTPLPGHVNPTLAVARELVVAGEEVEYHLPEPFRADVEATGACLHAVRVPSLASGAGDGHDPIVRLVLAPVATTRASLSVLPQILGGLEEDPPDVLVYDALSVWGRVAAELLPARAAMTCASYAMNRHFSYLLDGGPDGPSAPLVRRAIDGFAGDMHVLSAAYGVPRLGLAELFLHSEPLTIVFVAKQLQPAAETFDGRYVFVGPTVRAASRPLDGDLAHFVTAGPVVYVSLGTVFNRQWPEFYGLCTEALAGKPCRVVIAGAEREGSPAANVLVRERVEQLPLLARASVFVTHGGMNSAMEGLAAGVPMLCLPQVPEQALTAERIVAAGAGLSLARSEVTPEALRAAVVELSTDPGYGESARALWRAIIAESGGATAAARALTAYAAAEAMAT